MRVLLAVTIAAALVCGVAANEGETDVEMNVEHPKLPGMGGACFPVYAKQRAWHHKKRILRFDGVCSSESACPAGRSEPGYCAGIGTVCCVSPNARTPPVDTRVNADDLTIPAFTPSRILQGAQGPKCTAAGGTCGTPASCKSPNRTQSGLCPGASDNVCCVKGGSTTPTTPPTGTSLTSLIRIPGGINPGLQTPSASFTTSKIGSPGCALSSSCFSCGCATNNAVIKRLKVTMKVTDTVSITGLKPFVEAVQRAFAAMKRAGGTALAAYNAVHSAGGLCCRPIKRANGTPGSTYSNHSWGMAVDFYFGGSIDPRGDGKAQYGLSVMAPYFAREQLYWAAGYSGSSEDAMHFEASVQAINAWKAGGKL